MLRFTHDGQLLPHRRMSARMPRSDGFRVQRIYEDHDETYRVLVDRLWPRGVSKVDAALDDWLRDAAPSTKLRRWSGHDVERFAEFARRYRAELQASPAADAVRRLGELAETRTVTLLT